MLVTGGQPIFGGAARPQDQLLRAKLLFIAAKALARSERDKIK